MKCTIRVYAEAPQYALNSLWVLASAIKKANLETAYRKCKNGCQEFDFASRKNAKSAMRHAFELLVIDEPMSLDIGINHVETWMFYDAAIAKIINENEN